MVAAFRAKHHRRSIRLPDYDYAQPGTYFVTLVCKNRECLFGAVIDGKTRLSEAGEIVRQEWLRSAKIRSEMETDGFVVMPNHVHGIVTVLCVGAHGRAPLPDRRRQPRSLGSFVAGFKSAATKRINARRDSPGFPVWQRNYYERVIRNDRELEAVRRYIEDNPLHWDEDPENPLKAGRDGLSSRSSRMTLS